MNWMEICISAIMWWNLCYILFLYRATWTKNELGSHNVSASNRGSPQEFMDSSQMRNRNVVSRILDPDIHYNIHAIRLNNRPSRWDVVFENLKILNLFDNQCVVFK